MSNKSLSDYCKFLENYRNVNVIIKDPSENTYTYLSPGIRIGEHGCTDPNALFSGNYYDDLCSNPIACDYENEFEDGQDGYQEIIF